MSKRKEK